MAYFIDGDEISGGSWRHELRPSPMRAQREESFPGDPSRYMLVGPEPPPDILVTGRLDATSIANLNALMETYSAMRADTALHAITISGDTFADVYLASVRFEGPVMPGPVGVQRRTRFEWRQLQR